MNNFRRLLLLGLKEEKYVTLSGNGKCINTGILSSSNIRIEVKTFMDSLNDIDFVIYSECMLGSTSDNRYSFLKVNGKFRTDYRLGMYIIDGISTNIILKPTIIVKDGVYTYINGQLVYTISESDPFEEGNIIYIASKNSTYRRHIVYVYYVKIYRGDDLLLDLIPYNETDMINTLTGNIYTAEA